MCSVGLELSLNFILIDASAGEKLGKRYMSFFLFYFLDIQDRYFAFGHFPYWPLCSLLTTYFFSSFFL